MPVFRSIGTRATSASATSIAPTLPTRDTQNGKLIAVVTSKNNATHSCSTPGWSLFQQVNSGTGFTASLWQAAEGAAAPTFTWTGAAAASAQIAYYTDASGVMSAIFGATGSNTGTTSTHQTSSIVTTQDNALAIYIDVAAANTALGAVSGWTEDSDTGSSTDAGRTVFGSKVMGASGSSTGAISTSGAAAAWVQWQVELITTVATNSFETSKTELGTILEPPAGAVFGKAELGAWIDAPVEAAFSKAELGAWLDQPRRAYRQFIAIN